MTRSNTNCRTAVVEPTDGDSIREAHSYEYDNNGNIVYVNTSRVKPDMTTQPDTVQRAREELFRWDEENRLTALSQNGYVSHYWYNADGERTVKMHGGNMAVFVNSRQDGRVLDTQQTTAYFSPYFSIHEGQFTKHLYIGSERIASMTGTLIPGDVSNSQAGGNNISHAGYDVGVTQLNIPYATKCAAMRDSAEANYAHFGLPNALEGQTRQLREFVLPAGGDNEAEAPALRSGDKDNYNGNIWFIHTDHLGSSTLVTDGNGEASQQVEYLPYGEVFMEEQAGDYATPYKFNGKELDEETGLYYYGARYMNPRLSIWYGCDPLQEKYPSLSTYSYVKNNPIILIDGLGREPELSYIGTAFDFVGILNNSPRQVGRFAGQNAANYLRSLGTTEWSWSQMRPSPTQTGYFNKKRGRYIYTTKGGWIDMTHFMFYAGKAYDYKLQKEAAQKMLQSKDVMFMREGVIALTKLANMDPVNEAVKDGYHQEFSDKFAAKYSAYSYEDLPSDIFGAYFGASYFDPNSKLTLGEQIKAYLDSLGATIPQEAPNYKQLPKEELKTPSRTNHSTTPVYTQENP